ncbi:TetR/AcrR family transcriptional regulator [Rhodococcus sp. TAF43]|uniref:TetR/AcrR family transcriptional regulator n=1 Tax=unclassified Rhodococcus (in: high G+C Gram-positive bacteria) TaxID=192944 RepID=UPI000E0C40D0|nr:MULTISPECIES: TetR/AcrR family transcriptional regulator [unclassified Rhodococcus (in: high G+C Gram-positive bacteria)]QKT12000.1 TetR/AcrR family transcriptional regulator [Rhodococcus sp. W8901]RDI32651.1 TetR family transcriptional regulator [Rhodococcus sp. AG1013]
MASDTRDRILDALERLLHDVGVAHVTLEAVATAAGVSKGGLLYHFPSKEALLASMVRRLGDRSDQQLADAVAGGRTVSEIYLQYPGADSADEMALYRSMLAAMRSADGQHDEVQQAVADVMRSWDDGLLAEIDDPVQAEIVRLVGDGIYLAALLGLPEPDPELHRRVVNRLLGPTAAAEDDSAT